MASVESRPLVVSMSELMLRFFFSSLTLISNQRPLVLLIEANKLIVRVNFAELAP